MKLLNAQSQGVNVRSSGSNFMYENIKDSNELKLVRSVLLVSIIV